MPSLWPAVGADADLPRRARQSAESRDALVQLVEEQAALRRVATLVAGGTGADELFAVVADEVQQLLGAEASAIVKFEDDGTVVTVGTHGGMYPAGTRSELDSRFVVASVRDNRRAARFDTDDPAAADMPAIVQKTGIRSAVASPIVVEGNLWGAIVVGSFSRSLPHESVARLADFTELVATAVANTQARQEVTALADEQAALRRVAVLVAQQPSPSEVFTAVTQAVGLLLDADLAVLHVFPGDGKATTIASWSGDGPILPIGTRFPLDGDNLAARIFESGAPARLYTDDEAWRRTETDLARSLRMRSAVGAPILVEGKLWGALMAATRSVEPWAENAETRIAAFTELAATAIANAESRGALAELADEQAALRRVATLVAETAPPAEIFSAVGNEVAALFRTELVVVGKFDGDPAELLVVGVGDGTDEPVVGSRWKLDEALTSTAVYRTGLAARLDPDSTIADPDVAAMVERFRPVATVAVPIKVESRLWGAMIVSTQHAPLPMGTEDRLQRFTDLIATAIANAEAREARAVLTEEQAALRRVATLVARGAPPQELFVAAVEEVGRLLRVSSAALGRYEPDGMFTSVAAWSVGEVSFPVGRRWTPEGNNVAGLVLRTGRPARLDDFSDASGPIGVYAREAGIKSAVGAPITVEGRLWGMMTAASTTEEPLPAETETRLASFTELIATAIANADGRSELAASRRRIVAASDDARRRIERDLHDGVQQQLVSLALDVGKLEANPPAAEVLQGKLASVSEDVGAVLDSLVEIARGIHPAILAQGGLDAAINGLARRCPVPVEVEAEMDGQVPDEVGVAAYYVVSETLTNVAKHARASVVRLHAATEDGMLKLMVRDDGLGGAVLGEGSGLLGLQDRVEALGGTFTIDSAPGSGTRVVATLPVATESHQDIEDFLGPPEQLESRSSPA